MSLGYPFTIRSKGHRSQSAQTYFSRRRWIARREFALLSSGQRTLVYIVNKMFYITSAKEVMFLPQFVGWFVDGIIQKVRYGQCWVVK